MRKRIENYYYSKFPSSKDTYIKQSGVFIMQTKSRNPVLTINFENAMFIHPNLDLVNEPARPLLFTKSRYLLNQGGIYSKI